MDVLVGVVAAAAGIGTVWTLVRAVRQPAERKSVAPSGSPGENLLRRLRTPERHDDSKEHVAERAAARAASKRLVAQSELTALDGEGHALLERAEQWKENDERVWREDFTDFSRRLRDSTRTRLAPSAAMTIDLECKAVRQSSWPAQVSVIESAAGQLSAKRGTLVQAMETLLRTLAAATDAVAQTDLPAVPAELEGECIDALVHDAKQILEQIARSVIVSDYELWSLVHGWRDRMTEVLSEQGAQDAAEYITCAPPSKKIPFVPSVASMVPGQLQPMRQLAGWLERLSAWRHENAPRAG